MNKSFQDIKSGYYYHIVELNGSFVKANCYNQRAMNQQLQFSREYFNQLLKDGHLVMTDRSNIIHNKANYLGK